MLRYNCISIVALLLFAGLNAQQTSPWVIGSAGADEAQGDYQLSWTLGEPAILTLTQAEAALLQGFQQPNYVFDVLAGEPDGAITLQLYPNPTSGWVTLEISGTDEIMTAEVYNLVGALIYRTTVTAPRTRLDLGSLATGTYLLKIVNARKERLRVWRVQKMRE